MKKSKFAVAAVLGISKDPIVENQYEPDATPPGILVEPWDEVELSPAMEDLFKELAVALANDQEASPVGKPSKLTFGNVMTIARAILVGASYRDACDSVGIWDTTFGVWMKNGEKSDGDKYNIFHRIVKTANGECAVRYTQILNNAAATQDAKYALEWLKRRRKTDWGDNVDVTSKDEKIEFVVTYVTPTKVVEE